MLPRSPNLRSPTKDVKRGQGLLTSTTEPQLLDFIFQFVPVTVALSLCSGTRPNPGSLSSFLHKFQATQVNGFFSLWDSRRHCESLGLHTMRPLCEYQHASAEVNRSLHYLAHRVSVPHREGGVHRVFLYGWSGGLENHTVCLTGDALRWEWDR